jgi:hypothetical protein
VQIGEFLSCGELHFASMISQMSFIASRMCGETRWLLGA